MAIVATLQTRLACGGLVVIMTNVCLLIAIIAFTSKYETCRTNSTSYKRSPGIDSNIIHRKWIKTYPWMLSFLILPEQVFIGSGSIITKKWAITTAYAVDKASQYPISKKVIRGGSDFWNKGGFYHFVEKIIIHEKYQPYTLDYNIALIKVSYPFVNPNERPISLSEAQSKLIKNIFGEVIGWAVVDDTDNTNEHLLHSSVVLFSEEVCRIMLKEIKNDTSIFRSLCAKSKSHCLNTTTCIFSSGSALVIDNTLIGLASWGETSSKYPSVYLYLEKVSNWIDKMSFVENISIFKFQNT